MLWIAMRCRPAFSALTVFALAAAVRYDLTTSAGSSLVMPLDEYIVASQVLILFCSFSIMALALVNAERQETATALALSEQKFRAIYDRAFEFIGLLDPDGKLQDANQRALDFAGVTLSEVVGQPFCEGPCSTCLLLHRPCPSAHHSRTPRGRKISMKQPSPVGGRPRSLYFLTVGESVPPGAGLSWQAARAPICPSNLKPETAHRTGRLRKDGGVIS